VGAVEGPPAPLADSATLASSSAARPALLRHVLCDVVDVTGEDRQPAGVDGPSVVVALFITQQACNLSYRVDDAPRKRRVVATDGLRRPRAVDSTLSRCSAPRKSATAASTSSPRASASETDAAPVSSSPAWEQIARSVSPLSTRSCSEEPAFTDCCLGRRAAAVVVQSPRASCLTPRVSGARSSVTQRRLRHARAAGLAGRGTIAWRRCRPSC
jgi:hypothetical protein